MSAAKATVLAAALGLGVLGAAVFRDVREKTRPKQTVSKGKRPVVPSPRPASPVAVPAAPERATDQVYQIVARVEAGAGSVDAERLVSVLLPTLRGNPGAWRSVVELLACLEEGTALRMISLLTPAMDRFGEGAWIDLLRSAARAGARRLAAHALACSPTAEAIPSVAIAARQDPDPEVRRAALEALRRHAGHAEVIREATLSDPDPGIRAYAAECLRATEAPPRAARRSLLGRL